jgi:Protein of unknown function (DUF2798)
MISKRYERTIFALVMSLMMSFIMSGVITLINIGLGDFFSHWMKAFFPAWGLAFLAISMVLPVAHKIVKIIIKENK